MSDTPAGCDSFGRPRPGLRTLRRRDLKVRIAGNSATTARNPAAPVSPATGLPPDPATANARADIAEIQRRFAICKACEHSRDNAFACALHRTCCFGRFRSNPANRCPTSKW